MTKQHTFYIPVVVKGADRKGAAKAARLLRNELQSQLEYGLDALDDVLGDGVVVGIGKAAPGVLVPGHSLAVYVEAYGRLSSLAEVVSEGCDQADLPKSERGFEDETHRCAKPQYEAAINRALARDYFGGAGSGA